MKKIISLILTALLLASVIYVYALPEESIGTTVSENDLSLTVSTDKTSYAVGEDITVYTEITNNSDKTVYYTRVSQYANSTMPTTITNGEDKKFIDKSYYGENPTVMEFELKAGESKKQTINFKSGYATESYIGYFDETVGFEVAPAGIYDGLCTFEYSFEKGVGNSDKLENAFEVVISEESDLYEYDLYVSAVSASAEMFDGDESKLSATVRNLSDKAINELATVSFYIDNRLIETTEKDINIDANGYCVLSTDNEYAFLFGLHSVKAIITFSDSSITDTDTDNNFTKQRIYINDYQ